MMSSFVHTQCACGVEIIAVSLDEDDVRIAVASHNDLPKHREWRAVQQLQRKAKRGPCICRGGDVTNSPHTPQSNPEAGPRPLGSVSVPPRISTLVKIGHSS